MSRSANPLLIRRVRLDAALKRSGTWNDHSSNHSRINYGDDGSFIVAAVRDDLYLSVNFPNPLSRDNRRAGRAVATAESVISSH